MADIRVSDVKQMTHDRAALREIAERRAKDLESHKDCPLVDGEDIGDETCDLALQYHFARAYLDATAPLLVKCENCGGKGYIPDPWPESKTGWDCPACHGKGYVERADLAAIRKRAEAATPGPWRSLRDGNQYIKTDYIPTAECVGTSRVEGIVRPWNPHAVMAFKKFDEAHVARFLDADADFIANARTDIPALLDLIAAQAREIAELKGKANG